MSGFIAMSPVWSGAVLSLVNAAQGDVAHQTPGTDVVVGRNIADTWPGEQELPCTATQLGDSNQSRISLERTGGMFNIPTAGTNRRAVPDPFSLRRVELASDTCVCVCVCVCVRVCDPRFAVAHDNATYNASFPVIVASNSSYSYSNLLSFFDDLGLGKRLTCRPDPTVDRCRLVPGRALHPFPGSLAPVLAHVRAEVEGKFLFPGGAPVLAGAQPSTQPHRQPSDAEQWTPLFSTALASQPTTRCGRSGPGKGACTPSSALYPFAGRTYAACS